MARGQDIPALTGLRGVAALFVVFFHYFSGSDLGLLRPFFARGYISVDLFFVLSGLVMALTYARTFEMGFSTRDYVAFLGKRLGRVYPVYLVVLLVVIALLYGGWIDHDPPDGAKIASNLLMVQAWGFSGSINNPTWSISTEFAAYLLFPALVLGVFSGPRVLCWALAAAAVFALALVATRSTADLGQLHDGISRRSGPLDVSGGRTAYPLLRCLAGFTLGLAAFRVASAPFTANALKWWHSGDLVALLVAALLLVPNTDVLLAAAFVPLVVTLAAGGSWTAKLLARDGVVWLGKISYSLYLVHIPIEWGARGRIDSLLQAIHVPHSYTVAGLASLALAIAVSTGLFYLIERPARDWTRGLMRAFARVSWSRASFRS